MAEPTQASAPVEKGTDDASILRRLSAVVDSDPAETDPSDAAERPAPKEQQTEPAAPDAKETKPPSDPAELTADDLVEATTAATPPAEFELEIVHDGKPVKLNREEAITLARQGYDYTQKTQALAEKTKSVDWALRNAAEIEQMMPLLAKEQAEFVAAHQVVMEWQGVDWVKVAEQVSPQEYQVYQARFNAAFSKAQQAAAKLDQSVNAVKTRRSEAQQTILREQYQKLTNDYVPEWRDPERYKAEATELSQYLIREGGNPDDVAALSDAFAVKIALKAMKYDKALASKKEKSKLLQSAPPVARPGANPAQQNVQADKEQQAAKRLKKTGSLEDAVALYMHRLK